MRAAARVFRERGFSAAGMRDIGVAADLSPGNLYHYFRGKDELLFFCQDRAADRLLRALGAARRNRGPLPARLRDLATAHVLCLLDESRARPRTSRSTRSRLVFEPASSPSATSTNAVSARSSRRACAPARCALETPSSRRAPFSVP